MHVAEAVRIEHGRGADGLPSRLEIDGLPADHARRARGVGNDADDVKLARGEHPFDVDGFACEKREGFGLESVAGEHGDTVAVDDVQGWPSAAQRVVVHRGQVVVDQRVRVDQFDRARRRNCEGDDVPRWLGGFAALDRVGSCERQRGTQPLPAGKQAIAHGLAHDARAGWRLGQIAIEGRVDLAPRALQKLGEGLARHEASRGRRSTTGRRASGRRAR